MTFVRRHPIVTAVATLVLAACGLVAASAAVVWREAHHDDASVIERADAIVVLGAAQWNGTPSPVLQGRLDHALLLYRQGRAPVVITVGGNQPGDRRTEGASGRDYLASKGVPLDALVALPVGNDTWESMQAVSTWMHAHGDETAFLVSDPWHNARIQAMADDLGLEGYASATWTSAATSEKTRGEGYLRETFAYLAFRLFGGH
ncbi:MAG: YdcF family protein [Planctomycetaceae bacterium]